MKNLLPLSFFVVGFVEEVEVAVLLFLLVEGIILVLRHVAEEAAVSHFVEKCLRLFAVVVYEARVDGYFVVCHIGNVFVLV